VPRLIVTPAAAGGLQRCRLFLTHKNRNAAVRAGQAIERALGLLEGSPEAGRPFALDPELRELVIAFGESGYVALYRYEPDNDAVYVLAFRHQREAGYER
jgi:plasmid stabilization system protein ParE